MAMPNSKNNVTVRKLASALQGLWDKIKNAFLLKTSRGAANGVASLDANGKVPSSQLPKIGTSGIADDAITAALVKDGETLPVNISGTATTTKRLRYGYAYTLTSKGVIYKKLIKITASAISINQECQIVVEFINSVAGARPLCARCCLQLRKESTGYRYNAEFIYTQNMSAVPCAYYDSSTNDLYLYAKQGNVNVYSGVTAYILSETNFNGLPVEKTETYENATAETTVPYTRVNEQVLYVAKTREPSVGSSSVPIYINSDGYLAQCTGVPVIEHVTTIPVNPTVGTIYAL